MSIFSTHGTLRVVKQDGEVVQIVSQGPQGPAADLPSNVVLTDIENTFTSNQVFESIELTPFGGVKFTADGDTGYIILTATGALTSETITYAWPLAPAAFSGHVLNPGWLLSTDNDGNMAWVSIPNQVFYSRVYNQPLNGTRDDSNLTFTFADGLIVQGGSLAMFRNGIRQMLTSDYTVNYSTRTIVMTSPPSSVETFALDFSVQGVL